MAALTSAGLGGCLLGNLNPDRCAAEQECVDAFGLGSQCADGWCTEPTSCTTGHDCRRQHGGGACVAGICVDRIPPSPACFVFEPTSLPDERLTGLQSPILLGAIASLRGDGEGNDFDEAQVASIRVALRQIDDTSAGPDGRKLGLVACDNDGPGNDVFDEAEREKLNQAAVDYLAGTLGVPAIIGPLGSQDSGQVMARVMAKALPTVVVSPSATSPSLTFIEDRLAPDDPRGLFWRTCADDNYQGNILSTNVLLADTSTKSVSLVYVQDDYGQGLNEVIAAVLSKAGLTLKLAPYAPGTEDFGPLAAKVAADGADVIVLIPVWAGEAVGIINALAATSAATIPLFLTDSSKDTTLFEDPSLTPEAKAMIATARGTGPGYFAADPRFDAFSAELELEFGLRGDAFSFQTNSYDAAFVVALAVVYAVEVADRDYDGRTVAEGLASLSSGTSIVLGATTWNNAKQLLSGEAHAANIEGLSGGLDFDPDSGDTRAPIEIWHVAAGAFAREQLICPSGTGNAECDVISD